jgi:putative iron-regulated protein
MKKIYIVLFSAAMLTSISCKTGGGEPVVTPDANAQAVENYSNIVFATYEDSWLAAKDLKTAAAAFVALPSASGLEALRVAYIAARTPYVQSEAFRFYNGPIDDARGIEGLLNSWPLDEAFIDYVEGNTTAGIINDVAGFPSITAAVIEANNQTTGEEGVSCGYHAIEFLLWGQDLSETGPGERPYTDYVVGVGSTNSNQDRRGAYLLACIDLLIDNLNTLKNEWKPGVQNYRATFTSTPQGSVSNFLTGAFRYADGELSVERMQVALDAELDAGRQEHEQSCFSDQTHNDIKFGQQGIRNVYTGKYIRIDGSVIEGTGLSQLVQNNDAVFNATVLSAILDADVAVNLIHSPFDNEIVLTNTAGRLRVQNAIDALHEEAAKFQAAGAKLGMIIQ